MKEMVSLSESRIKYWTNTIGVPTNTNDESISSSFNKHLRSDEHIGGILKKVSFFQVSLLREYNNLFVKLFRVRFLCFWLFRVQLRCQPIGVTTIAPFRKIYHFSRFLLLLCAPIDGCAIDLRARNLPDLTSSSLSRLYERAIWFVYTCVQSRQAIASHRCFHPSECKLHF